MGYGGVSEGWGGTQKPASAAVAPVPAGAPTALAPAVKRETAPAAGFIDHEPIVLDDEDEEEEAELHSAAPASVPATQSTKPARALITPNSDGRRGSGAQPPPVDSQPRGDESSDPRPVPVAQPAGAEDSCNTPRRSTRSRRSVLASGDGGGGGGSSSSSSSSPSSTVASLQLVASPQASPATVGRGRKRKAASPAAAASPQAVPAAKGKKRKTKSKGQATAEDPEEADAEEEAGVNAGPEGFWRATIMNVLGGGMQTSWVHPRKTTIASRRLGPVNIGERYCVLRRSWNPELPSEPGQPGFAYFAESVEARVFTAHLMRQSYEFGGVLLVVPFAHEGTSRCQIMGYYSVSEPVATTFAEMRQKSPDFFKHAAPVWLDAVLDGAGLFWGRNSKAKLEPEMPNYNELLQQQKEEEAKYERRAATKKEIKAKMGASEADGALREWAAAELEPERLLQVPFTPVPEPRGAQLRELLERKILPCLRDYELEG
eukprot:tig00021726_g23264.t1